MSEFPTTSPDLVIGLVRVILRASLEQTLRQTQETLSRLDAFPSEQLIRDWTQLSKDCPDFQDALTILIQWFSDELQERR